MHVTPGMVDAAVAVAGMMLGSVYDVDDNMENGPMHTRTHTGGEGGQENRVVTRV